MKTRVDRRGALLRAPILFCLLISGCRQSTKPAAAPVVGYVRMDALLPSHPGWKQIGVIDEELKQLNAALSAPGKLPPQSFPAFAPLRSETATINPIPDSSAEARKRAAERADRLSRSLSSLNSQRIAREEKAGLRKIGAAAAAERARLLAVPPDVVPPIPDAIKQELRKLELERIALQSRIRVQFDPELSRTEQRLADLEKRWRELNAEIRTTPGLVEKAVDGLVEQVRRAEEQKVFATLDQHSKQLAEQSDLKLKQFRELINKSFAALPPKREPHTVTVPSLSTPVEAAPTPKTSKPPVNIDPMVQSQKLRLEKEKQELIAVLRSDLELRLQAIAGRKNWKLGTKAEGQDFTNEAAVLLKQEWGLRQ